MKIKFEKFKRPASVLGYFTLEMKYIIANIEYRYFVETGQLNLKLMHIEYKIKDKKKRLEHSNDFLKSFAQRVFIKKIRKRLKEQLEEISQTEFPKPTAMKKFWWESK